jgi:hypothetical protein
MYGTAQAFNRDCRDVNPSPGRITYIHTVLMKEKTSWRGIILLIINKRKPKFVSRGIVITPVPDGNQIFSHLTIIHGYATSGT